MPIVEKLAKPSFHLCFTAFHKKGNFASVAVVLALVMHTLLRPCPWYKINPKNLKSRHLRSYHNTHDFLFSREKGVNALPAQLHSNTKTPKTNTVRFQGTPELEDEKEKREQTCSLFAHAMHATLHVPSFGRHRREEEKNYGRQDDGSMGGEKKMQSEVTEPAAKADCSVEKNLLTAPRRSLHFPEETNAKGPREVNKVSSFSTTPLTKFDVSSLKRKEGVPDQPSFLDYEQPVLGEQGRGVYILGARKRKESLSCDVDNAEEEASWAEVHAKYEFQLKPPHLSWTQFLREQKKFQIRWKLLSCTNQLMSFTFLDYEKGHHTPFLAFHDPTPVYPFEGEGGTGSEAVRLHLLADCSRSHSMSDFLNLTRQHWHRESKENVLDRTDSIRFANDLGQTSEVIFNTRNQILTLFHLSTYSQGPFAVLSLATFTRILLDSCITFLHDKPFGLPNHEFCPPWHVKEIKVLWGTLRAAAKLREKALPLAEGLLRSSVA